MSERNEAKESQGEIEIQMTNEEMKRALAKGGMTTADIEKVSDRFDAEKLTEMVEAAHTPEEAFKAIHSAYPELAVSELEKQCNFIQGQFEAAMSMKEQKNTEPIELTEDELANVSGGGFCDWWSKNWKAVVVGAAILVGSAAITAVTFGATGPLLGGVLSVAAGQGFVTGVIDGVIIGLEVGATAGALGGTAIAAATASDVAKEHWS